MNDGNPPPPSPTNTQETGLSGEDKGGSVDLNTYTSMHNLKSKPIWKAKKKKGRDALIKGVKSASAHNMYLFH